MKQLYLLILSTFIFFVADAQPNKVPKKYKGGSFASPKSWSPSETPVNGDVFIVETGTTLEISGALDLQGLKNITLVIDGTLYLNKATLLLESNSSIYLRGDKAQIIPNGNGNNNTISIGNEEKYESKVGPIQGQIYADANTGSTKNKTNAPFKPYSGPVPALANIQALPVTFTSFTVSKFSNSISIKWSTSEEVNADIFQIERSEDGKTWRTVGKVRAVGNSNIVNNYTFTDNALFSNTAFYRIKQIDIDGKFIYTEVKAVTNKTNQPGATNNASIIAAGNNVIVNFAKEVKGSVVVRLISFGGQVIAQQSYNQPSQQIVFNKTSINKGNYIVFVSNNHDLNVSKQITL